MVDNVDLRSMDPSHWRRQIGTVAQVHFGIYIFGLSADHLMVANQLSKYIFELFGERFQSMLLLFVHRFQGLRGFS